MWFLLLKTHSVSAPKGTCISLCDLPGSMIWCGKWGQTSFELSGRHHCTLCLKLEQSLWDFCNNKKRKKKRKMYSCNIKSTQARSIQNILFLKTCLLTWTNGRSNNSNDTQSVHSFWFFFFPHDFIHQVASTKADTDRATVQVKSWLRL